MTEILIRYATRADLEQITSWNQQMAWETEERVLDPVIAARGVSMLLDQPSRGFYLLAEISGQIVGQCMITYEWSDWRCGDFWWIQSVYISPEFRRRGVFTALHQYISSAAMASENVAGIRLYVEQENVVAIQTYQDLGLLPAHYLMFEADFTRTSGSHP